MGLDTELPQMMIKMLVRQDGPLVRRERAEKTVWVFGAAISPGAAMPPGAAISPAAYERDTIPALRVIANINRPMSFFMMEPPCK